MRNRKLSSFIRNIHRSYEIFRAWQVTNQWWHLTLAYLNLRPLHYPFVFRTRKGSQMTLNSRHDMVTVWVVFIRQEYRLPPRAKTVIDAGANIGTFSIFASEVGNKKIIALEPFPETIVNLRKNISDNNLQQKVAIWDCALAGASGTARMDLSEAPSQSRGLMDESDEVAPAIQVKTLSLHELLSKTGESEIDFFKMDIEGGEHEVLRHTHVNDLRKIKEFAMEYHPGGSKQQLFSVFKNAGFRLKSDYKISHESGVAHFERM